MYAVFKSGGHQYVAKQGEKLDVQKIEGKEGDKITFDKVLMVGGSKTAVGSPFVSGAKVEAKITKQFRAPKVTIFKYRRRKNYKLMRGHKQPLTKVEITKISG